VLTRPFDRGRESLQQDLVPDASKGTEDIFEPHEARRVSRSEIGFDEFVRENALKVGRFAYMLTGDSYAAEDLVQQVLMKIHRKWNGAIHASNPLAYVRRAIVNEFISSRRVRSHKEVLGSMPEIGGPDWADVLVQRDLIWRALARLPRRQRAVLVLRYYESVPDVDIASILGCAEGTVRSLATRGFDALRRRPEIAREIGPDAANRGDLP